MVLNFQDYIPSAKRFYQVKGYNMHKSLKHVALLATVHHEFLLQLGWVTLVSFEPRFSVPDFVLQLWRKAVRQNLEQKARVRG